MLLIYSIGSCHNRELGEYKESSNGIWGKIKYRSEEVRKVGYGRKKIF